MREIKLNKEQEELVLKNMRLVHYLVQKKKVYSNSDDYDDLVSVGNIGLIKAASTFDASMKIAFATYASTCINNEILMYYRKENKYAYNISLDEPIHDDGDGNGISLGETISHPDSNFVDEILIKDEFIRLVSIVLNYLTPRKKIIMLYRMADMPQVEIEERLKISQSYISRLEKKIITEIRNFVKNPVYYKEVFSMSIANGMYNFTFSTQDVVNFNKVLANYFQSITSVKMLPEFNIICNKNRVTISVTAQLESFAFIAQIMQEIDDFRFKYVPDDSNALDETISDSEDNQTQSTDELQGVTIVEDTVQADEDDKKIKSVDNETKTQIISDDLSTSKEVDKSNLTEVKATIKKGNQQEKVRKYILSLDAFTVKQLKNEFPNVSVYDINNALTYAKKHGLITAIGRGNYIVNKN